MKKLLLSFLVMLAFTSSDAQTLTIINHVPICSLRAIVIRDYPIPMTGTTPRAITGVTTIPPGPSTTVFGTASPSGPATWTDGAGTVLPWDPRQIFAQVSVTSFCSPSTWNIPWGTVNGTERGLNTDVDGGRIVTTSNFIAPASCEACNGYSYTVTWTDLGPAGVQIDIN
jgi:hypothetical protein